MGVETNTYQIPNLVLGDTFHEWLTVSNNSIIAKLNNISTYAVTAGTGIDVSQSTSGLATVSIAKTIPHGITFTGNVVFNGSVTTVNSTNLTIDDYNIVLGDVENGNGTADVHIDSGGGGGVILKRKDGADASFLWGGITTGSGSLTFNTLGVGCSGAWTCTDYINLTGGVGLKSTDDTLRFKSGVNATGAGLMVSTVATAGIMGQSYSQKAMKIGHMSTASAAITQGIYFDEDGLVRIYDGVNKKLFTHASHGFTFGMCVRLNGLTCQPAHGNSEADAEVLGIISEVPNANQFVVTMQGEIRGDFSNGLGVASGAAGSTLAPGGVYFLSGTQGNSGEVTNQEPATAGKIRKPMLIGFGPTAGYVLSYVGAKIAPEVDTMAPMMRRISIASDGSKDSGNSDLTSHSPSTGVYGITHDFATAEYSVSIAPVAGSNAMFANVNTKSNNYVTINVYNGSNTLTANAIEVILAKAVN